MSAAPAPPAASSGPPAAARTARIPGPRPRLRLRREDGEHAPRGEMNMTSMTDVIFILLVFFIALAQIRSSQLELEVPEVAEDPAATEDDAVASAVEITRTGEIALDGQPVDLAALVAALEARRERDGREPRVRIRGDREGHFGVFAQVLASLSQAKLHRIEIEVQGRGGS